MNNYPKIWLLRHGQTEWNAEGRIQGQLESRLSATGIIHAERQAELIAPMLSQDPACFVSPLGRAQETARIALNGREFDTDPRLAEANAGAFQGLTRVDIKNQWPGVYQANPRNLDLFCEAPGGEGYDSFRQRIAAFLNDLRQPSVVVAHGLLGQVMRGLVTGLSRAEMAFLPNEQGCIYVLENGRESVLR